MLSGVGMEIAALWWSNQGFFCFFDIKQERQLYILIDPAAG